MAWVPNLVTKMPDELVAKSCEQRTNSYSDEIMLYKLKPAICSDGLNRVTPAKDVCTAMRCIVVSATVQCPFTAKTRLQ